MRPLPSIRTLLPALACAALSANAAVVVSFTDPREYTDAGAYTWDAESNLKQLETHLQKLGERYLAPNQTLRVEVLDVDLAGWPRWGARGAHEVRVLNGGADWPAIRLRYTLESPAGTTQTREETVSDSGYLMHGLRARASESLYYEKRMLEEWFKTRFADGARR